MAPTGNIHFHPASDKWSEDFSREPLSAARAVHPRNDPRLADPDPRALLPLLMRHPFCRYAYELMPDRPFGRYGLEQQAEIVRHAFLAERGVQGRSAPIARSCHSPDRAMSCHNPQQS